MGRKDTGSSRIPLATCRYLAGSPPAVQRGRGILGFPKMRVNCRIMRQLGIPGPLLPTRAGDPNSTKNSTGRLSRVRWGGNRPSFGRFRRTPCHPHLPRAGATLPICERKQPCPSTTCPPRMRWWPASKAFPRHRSCRRAETSPGGRSGATTHLPSRGTRQWPRRCVPRAGKRGSVQDLRLSTASRRGRSGGAGSC